MAMLALRAGRRHIAARADDASWKSCDDPWHAIFVFVKPVCCCAMCHECSSAGSVNTSAAQSEREDPPLQDTSEQKEPARSVAALPPKPVRASAVDSSREAAPSPRTVSSPFRFTDDDVDAMVREAEAELRAARESSGTAAGSSNGAGSSATSGGGRSPPSTRSPRDSSAGK